MQSRISGCVVLLLLMIGCGKNLDQQLRDSVQTLDNAQLKKDQVEILSVQRTGDVAIAEVKIRTALKLRKTGDTWHLEEIRLGDRRWEKAGTILAAINQDRSQITVQKLALMRQAIEDHRSAQGKIPDAQDFEELIDQLSPRYLKQVIRLDSWWRGFSFRRISETEYDLRSAGADGEFQTSDDIQVQAAPK